MVFLPPPHLASASRPSYAEAYADILATHRRFPLISAASVAILVAPDVDALCAARMLVGLFEQDDVTHTVIPVSGIAELELMRETLMTSNEVRLSPPGVVWRACLLTGCTYLASYAHIIEYRRYPGFAFGRVVWRLSKQVARAYYRFESTMELVEFVCGRR